MAILVDNFSGTPFEGKGETIALDYGARVDTQPVFVGFAPPGKLKSDAAWKIMQLLYDGSSRITDRQWALNAQSNAAFDQIWNNRASLTYG